MGGKGGCSAKVMTRTRSPTYQRNGRPSAGRCGKIYRGGHHIEAVIHCSSFCLGPAPTSREASLPSLNTSRVGIDMTPYLAAVFGLSSTLSLTILTLLPSEPAISSSAGAIMRQGPHHSAQKSTTTGPAALSTADSKSVSETLRTAMGLPRCFLGDDGDVPAYRRTYERVANPSRQPHADMRQVSAASSASGGISIKSGTSVHTRAARMDLPG